MRFAICLAVLVASFATHAARAAQTTADRMASITSELKAGEFDRALQVLDLELKRNPNSAQLWTMRGLALSGKGDKKQALAAFRKALGVAPDYLPALEGAAQIEYESGDKDAVVLLQRILKLLPRDPTSHAMLAVLAYRQGDCPVAVQHFEQSGPLVDSQPGALQEYGACLLRLKQNEKAVTAFSRALAQSNGDPGARYRLASVQMMAQRPNDALETVQPLLRGNSPSSEVLELAAMANEANGNTPEAVRTLRKAIVTNPHDINLYLDFANVSMDHQSYQVGVDMIDAGLRAEPNAAALYVARGVLYVQLAQYDKAESDFAKADAIDPRQSSS